MKLNQAGLRLIKEFEGCSLVSYQDQAGIWTIGYGTTKGISPRMVFTSEQCEDRLLQDINVTEMVLNHLITYPVNENQFSACVCLAYNIGRGHFSISTLLTELNQGHFIEAADQFLVWNKVNHQVNDGLSRRRKAERDLFMS